MKGPNVMKGYYKKPEATAKVIDENGWLHTGDQGKFDQRGNLIITGRIKEIIITSYGKNIAPAPIEACITKSRYIRQAMVHGDNRKHLVALIVPDPEAIADYAKENGIPHDDYQKVLGSTQFKKMIANELDDVNVQLAPHEMIRKFALIPEEFTTENAMLTPTLKLRRPAIVQKYQSLIESLYSDHFEE